MIWGIALALRSFRRSPVGLLAALCLYRCAFGFGEAASGTALTDIIASSTSLRWAVQ